MRQLGLLILVILLGMTSCVSSKKYKTLALEKSKTDAVLAETINKQKLAEGSLAEAKVEIKVLQNMVEGLQNDTLDLGSQVRGLQKEKNALETRVENLMKEQKSQISTASAELRKLNEALTQKEQELEAKADGLNAAQVALQKAQTILSEKEKSIATLEASLFEREKRVRELESAIEAQQEKSKALREKLATALLGFSESELTVEQRNGKVYVSLSQDLLFASGSTAIDKKGKQALGKLAEVLNKNTDIAIAIEGHTDNVPLSGKGGMKDNWDLSVMRSTAIVRVLIEQGVDPKRITAAGRGEFFPVADNTTSTGRAKNRRSEIILSPKLDELYQLIQN